MEAKGYVIYVTLMLQRGCNDKREYLSALPALSWLDLTDPDQPSVFQPLWLAVGCSRLLQPLPDRL